MESLSYQKTSAEKASRFSAKFTLHIAWLATPLGLVYFSSCHFPLSIFDPVLLFSVLVTTAAWVLLLSVLPFSQCCQWNEERQLALFSLINTESVLAGMGTGKEGRGKIEENRNVSFLHNFPAFVSPVTISGNYSAGRNNNDVSNEEDSVFKVIWAVTPNF